MKDVDVTQKAFNVVKRDALKNIHIEGGNLKDIFQNTDLFKNEKFLNDLSLCKNLAEEIEMVLKKANSVEEIIINSSFVGFLRGLYFGITITKSPKTNFFSKLFKI
jgi:hypothetical protein